MALTEVYCAKYVPQLIPEFVDSHITEDDGMYMFEVNPEHPTIKEIKQKKQLVERVLEQQFSFKSVVKIYAGERPSF
jgi:hypothetical protein